MQIKLRFVEIKYMQIFQNMLQFLLLIVLLYWL